jgi:O-antigen/teichoic acid export membrane protein
MTRLQALRAAILRPDGSLLSGTGSLIGSRLVVAGLGWGGTIIIVRQLTTADWGAFSLVFGVLGLVGMLSDLRLSRVVIESLQVETRRSSTISSYFTFRLLLGLVGYGAAIAFVLLGGYERVVVLATVIGAFTLILGGLTTALLVYFQSRLSMQPVALGLTFGQILQFGLIIVVALTGRANLLWFVVPAVLNEVLHLAWLLWLLRPTLSLRFRVDLREWGGWLREVAPVALGGALASLYSRIDIIMLSRLDGLPAVGEYSIGYKFADLVTYIPYAVMTPILTLLVRAWPEDVGAFRTTFQQTLSLLYTLAIGLAVAFIGFAGPIVVLAYGERYSTAVGAMQVLVAAQALHFLTALCWITLLAVSRNVAYPVAALVGLIVNIGLNLWLIPTLSFVGAAVATLVTEVTVLVMLGTVVLRLHGIRPLPWRLIGLVSLAGAVTFGFVLVQPAPVPWMVTAVLSGGLYLLLLHLSRAHGPRGLWSLVDGARLSAPDEAGGTSAH